MSTTCNEGTNIPILLQEQCNGEYISTLCIINAGALTYLNLPINSSVFTIINTLILSLQYKDEVISQLTDALAALALRVTALES